MNVGVLDLLSLPASHVADVAYHFALTKQFASITPQSVAVWCRRLGHKTHYATYYGLGSPARQLPAGLDLVFISCHTQASALAYALARLFRASGARTIIGGPHAKAFPLDCARFFDIVVGDCDSLLVADILADRIGPGSMVSSDRSFEPPPPVQERLPDIRKASLVLGRWNYGWSLAPVLASTGCPYNCNFCVEWHNPYRLLPLDQLESDLRFLSTHFPGAVVGFQDPAFAVRFDRVLDVLESLPRQSRPRYMMESTLSVLRGPRLKRLSETKCVMAAPGVESWSEYSNKTGPGRLTGEAKVHEVVAQFERLREHVPYLQANLLFGLDCDAGDEPVELTREFMTRTPFVWPTVNIPVPFGGTPLYEDLLARGRVLRSMPFSFYYTPYLVSTLEHYDPVGFYERLIGLFEHATSREMLRRRLSSTPDRRIRLVHRARTASMRVALRRYRMILDQLRSDAALRAFHEGRSSRLPEFYHRLFERMLGRYAPLIPRAERIPDTSHLPLRGLSTPSVLAS